MKNNLKGIKVIAETFILLIERINASGNHHLDADLLEEIVRTDEKHRYPLMMIIP